MSFEYKSGKQQQQQQGRIQDFWKGAQMCLDKGVRFVDFISVFLKYTMKMNNLVSVRPNYFIFMGYLKTGGRGVGV